MVVKTGPTAPKVAVCTVPVTGPNNNPIKNNQSTSGILVRVKSVAK
jgi:hypothetical protein